jgi:hypothetical protein
MKFSQKICRFAVGLVAVGVFLGGNLASAQPDAKKNATYPKQVLLIRHAEKTGEKADLHLSKKGKERADVLFQLFVASKERPDPFPTPDFIFAGKNDKSSYRPVETVTPFAMKLKMPINSRYHTKLPAALGKKNDKTPDEEGMLGLRDELFGDAKYAGKTILVSWRHGTISELAKTLKASKVPAKWEDEIFDRVWQIRYDEKGTTTFLDRPQRLLPGDAEK